jgi:hypothetical protein
VISQDLGENLGGQSDTDGLPMSSVVYVGRGSFRMEAVAIDAEFERRQGVVQPMTAAVTAPLHAPARTRTSVSAGWRAPALRPLFGSQADVPLLAAPTGAVGVAGTEVSISRAALAALSGVVLLCGVVIGTAVRHLLASPAAVTTVSAPARAPTLLAKVELAPTVVPVAATAPPAAPSSIVQRPTAIAIHARPKPAVKRPPVETVRKAPVKPIASPWVDPFAE